VIQSEKWALRSIPPFSVRLSIQPVLAAYYTRLRIPTNIPHQSNFHWILLGCFPFPFSFFFFPLSSCPSSAIPFILHSPSFPLCFSLFGGHKTLTMSIVHNIQALEGLFDLVVQETGHRLQSKSLELQGARDDAGWWREEAQRRKREAEDGLEEDRKSFLKVLESKAQELKVRTSSRKHHHHQNDTMNDNSTPNHNDVFHPLSLSLSVYIHLSVSLSIGMSPVCPLSHCVCSLVLSILGNI
jgi:hypothetical protein